VKKLSVAMVAACPFPANWGTPGSIREMATALAARGHQVHVVTYPFGEDLPVKGAVLERAWYWKKTGRLQSGPFLEKFLLDLFLLIKLIRVVRREKIDLIHAHGYEAVLIGTVAKLLTGRPLIYHAHNLMSDELPAYRFFPGFVARSLGRVLDWMVPRFPDHIITLTSHLKNAVMAEQVPAERVDVIPISVDPAMFEGGDGAALRTRYNLDSRQVVMYTGICSPLQRLDYLLQAFAVAQEAEPEARLMVVTPLKNDPDLPRCQQLAGKLGIADKVIWVPGHQLRELRDYLALATMTVISRPKIPGQPVKLLNAMSASRPTVCFAGASEGAQHLREAFIVPGDDWRQLGAGIVTLLRDAKLAAAMGHMAHDAVLRNYSTTELCSRIESVYIKVTPHSAPRLTDTDAATVEPDIANS
jgi:glycosyltransferase involved in cell wall biosynthesis